MELALLFLRVSSKGQEDNYSLDAQEKLGYAYAANNNNKLKIVKIWRVAESAWDKKERKIFNQMVEYAKKHPEIKHIIFDSLDRMTRNDTDKVKILDLISEHDKHIHFARTNRIYNRNSSPDDEFMLDVDVMVAKRISKIISTKTRMGQVEAAEQGDYPHYPPR